jgi:hypothetical protein
MTELMSFDEAIGRSDSQHREILLGNGFSIRHFSYRNLLEKAELDDSDPIRELFSRLDTYDFEAVIRALDDASLVASAYGHQDLSDRFSADAVPVKEGLVHAIRRTHAAHREEIAPLIPNRTRFVIWTKTPCSGAPA